MRELMAEFRGFVMITRSVMITRGERQSLVPGPGLNLLVWTLLFFSFSAAPLAGVEYLLYGDGTLSSQAGGEESFLQGELSFTADHTLLYPWGEARLRHRLAFNIPGDEMETMAGEQIEHRIIQASILYLPLPGLSLALGRHQLGWGMSYAFFPADALHPLRSADGDVPGLDGISSVWTISPDWSLTGALRLDEAVKSGEGEPWWEELRYGVSLSGYLGGVDLLLSQVFKVDEIFRPGLGCSFQAGGFVFTLEGAAEFLSDSRFYETEPGSLLTRPEDWEPGWKIAAGVERSFYTDRSTLSLLGEYFYDARGLDSRDRDALFLALPGLLASDPDAPDTFSGSGALQESLPVHPGRHYLFALLSFDLDGQVSTEHFAYINLEEPSAIVSHRLGWSNGEALELFVQGGWIAAGAGKNEAALLEMLQHQWSAGVGARIFF